MNKQIEPIMRTHDKLGFTPLETAEIVNLLNKLLANYHIHAQKLRNFHWNVEGSHFFELHKKFDELYHEVQPNIDAVAERVRILGKRPSSTLREYLTISDIKEVEKSVSSYQMVKKILDDFEILLSFIMDVTDAALRIGDTGTADMMTTFMRKTEKNHWMFSAWIKDVKKQ